MLERHYDELRELDRDYWWFAVRHHYAWRLVRAAAPGGPGLLLDVGAGTGGFLAQLLARGRVGREQVLAIEGSREAARVGSERGIPYLCADLERLGELELPGAPDVITLLDVLEHLEEPARVLSELGQRARPGAHLVVLVPALQQLWSRWDERLGHRRRYDRPSLRRDLEQGGWRPLRLRYLFAPLVLPGLLRERLLRREEVAQTQFVRVPALVNRALTAAFIAESWLPALPFGTTLAALAVRAEPGRVS